MPESKTDVYREGNYVHIAKLEGKYCPVAILRRYIEAHNLDLSSNCLYSGLELRPSRVVLLGFIFIKVLGFARDPSISDFAWCFVVI